jgi:hypothetical protein
LRQKNAGHGLNPVFWVSAFIFIFAYNFDYMSATHDLLIKEFRKHIELTADQAEPGVGTGRTVVRDGLSRS